MTTHILILCTHNSARSVLAEAMLNHWAQKLGKDVRGHSAGSAPRGQVHALALEVLADAGVDTARLRSKSWDEFAQRDAPALRLVITVCDNAAAETCPLWPGGPLTVHWGYADPSAGAPAGPLAEQKATHRAEQKAAFELTRQALGYRLLQLLQLPLEAPDDAALRRALAEVGQS